MASRTPAIPLSDTYREITRDVARIPFTMPARIPWLIAFILSLALLALYGRRGLLEGAIPVAFSTPAVIIAQTFVALPFLVLSLEGALRTGGERHEAVAATLGARPSAVFFRVTLPLVMPGIIAAALLSFSLSFDDFIITNFNSGNSVTFPMYVWGAAGRGTPVQINVIGTAMMLIAVIVVGVGQLAGGRRKARA